MRSVKGENEAGNLGSHWVLLRRPVTRARGGTQKQKKKKRKRKRKKKKEKHHEKQQLLEQE
ncbi:hypothetical protein I7I50_12544 [Histoplasma capsulatum G186AR]|nr:hypothetical protein I7I50_12544 [Histoplasma capsulatum G186AR]